MSHILLIGFMGAGKSTVGRRVSEMLDLPFIDLDVRVEQRLGASVAEIFHNLGEPTFREAESEALADLEDEPSSVVACGGGVVVDDENRRILNRLGQVIYLRVSAEEALARIGDTHGRPLLSREDAVAKASTLLALRESLYRLAADAVIETSGVNVDEVASAVVDVVRSAGTKG